MKYKEWLDVWFANYIEPSSKTKTCERYSEIIEKHLKVKLGEYELEELSPIVIQKYITELMQSGNLTTGKGLAANSVNGIITVIQNSLKLAYTLGELKEYTTDKIRRPKTKEKEVSCFSLAEQKKIEQAALSSKKRKFIGIVICLYSGLRIGELLALTWADIDFTKGTLAVNKTCHDGRDENGNLCRITDLPKTTSSKRMIPLPKQLIPVLKEYKRKSISEYVVESEKGEPPTVRSYQRTFELLQKRLHIERNIVILMADNIGADKIALREKVRNSLNRLLGQNYIGRSGDVYNFLTDEEQDIQSEIKKTVVDTATIVEKIAHIIFGDIYTNKKFRHDKYDFSFDQMVDGVNVGAVNGGMKLKFLSVATDAIDKSEMRLMTESAGQIIAVLGDTPYYTSLEQAMKIRKYIKQRNVAQLPKSVQDIRGICEYH